MTDFVVMAKPVGSSCNMRCSYCYYLGKNTGPDKSGQGRMRYGMLERLIRQTMESCQGKTVSFTWHGGEPTLAGLDFYEQVVELEQKYLPSGCEAWNNLQTNGLLLDEKWCRFLKENHFDVGVSIDGTEEAHDRNRPDAAGNPTFKRACRAVRLLEDAGISPDLLCTVNAQTAADPLGVYRALRDLDTGWMQFIPVVVRTGDGGVTAGSVTAEGYGNFLCAVFDEWIENDIGRTDVQLFAETAHILTGGRASLCWMAPTCGRVLIAEADGSVYSCDHFVDADHRLGSLKTKWISDMADSSFQLDFGRAKQKLTRQCRRCRWLKFCGGGCPKDRFALSEDGESGQYFLCAGLEKFFAHALGPLKKAMRQMQAQNDASASD